MQVACNPTANCSGHGACVVTVAPDLGMETNSSCACASGYRTAYIPVSVANDTIPVPARSSLFKEPVAGCDQIPIDIYAGLGQIVFYVVIAGSPTVLCIGLVVGCLSRLALREADRMRLIRRGIVKYCDECDSREGGFPDGITDTTLIKTGDIETPLHAIRADLVEVNADLCVLLPPSVAAEHDLSVATKQDALPPPPPVLVDQPRRSSAIPTQPLPVAQLTSDGGPAGDPGSRARSRWGGSVGPPEAQLQPVASAAAASARADPPPVRIGELLGPPAVPVPRLDGTAASGVLEGRLDWAGLGPGMSRETVGRRQTVRIWHFSTCHEQSASSEPSRESKIPVLYRAR
jgi:hypothetical protein